LLSQLLTHQKIEITLTFDFFYNETIIIFLQQMTLGTEAKDANNNK